MGRAVLVAATTCLVTACGADRHAMTTTRPRLPPTRAVLFRDDFSSRRSGWHVGGGKTSSDPSDPGLRIRGRGGRRLRRDLRHPGGEGPEDVPGALGGSRGASPWRRQPPPRGLLRSSAARAGPLRFYVNGRGVAAVDLESDIRRFDGVSVYVYSDRGNSVVLFDAVTVRELVRR
jgi:hypothetical protein